MYTKEFNDTTHEFPGDSCLTDLLWDEVRRRPGSTAVAYGADRLTYRDLAARSTDLALCLRHFGVSLDECVGVFVEPSIDLMVAAWGILFAGGAYLPLSPEYPDERLRYMIADAGVGVIVCQATLAGKLARLAPADVRIVTLEDAAALAPQPAEPGGSDRETVLTPDNLAYVIYTSGSTGKPKGVMIEHRSVVNQMNWLKTVQGLGPDTTVLQKTPMSFDAAQWEILAPCCGAEVVMGSPGSYRDAELLVDTIIEHDVTTLQCVPTLLQALLDTERFHHCKSLTRIFSGGEALSRGLALECLEALPWCDLINLYGPTECTINSSAHTVDRATVAEGPHTISIGGPVHNTHYHILDQAGIPVAAGEIGELHIGGVQLARGYLNRPRLSAERFVDNPFPGYPGDRLYRTGDLAHWNPDGTVQFAGRVDNQVKLRGFRVELDEIRLAIETHDWVRSAAVVVKDNPRTGFQNLIAYVELNPREAALMDQGNHDAHHQSKQSKLQLKAQLANLGCREAEELDGKPVVDLPGREPTSRQRQQVFARKTYRFFEGGAVTYADILRLLAGPVAADVRTRELDRLDLDEFGEIFRYFGQYRSDERLLPKYGYASPGALYATQLYVELNRVAGLASGIYYYHPVHHQLALIRPLPESPHATAKVHFIGKKRAIQPVYKNNIQEVLEIETGHMIGLFEQILPEYGLAITDGPYLPATRAALECAEEDYYLGTFELVPHGAARPTLGDRFEIYIQAHPGRIADVPAGQYLYQNGVLRRISDELILKKHVIAINQQVYERASLGITVISRTRKNWMSYVDLGRKLQHFEMNDINLGFMSSGYSSRTGYDLPSAKRIDSILEAGSEPTGPSYFFVGGRISDEQLLSEGMKEDTVHMRGPAEMIKDDLADLLPDYMVPNRVTVLDRLPHTANGKIDQKALDELDKSNLAREERQFVAPRTATEVRIGALWSKEMRRDSVSVHDDFFESGGNSLIAVGLINKINREFRSSLPLQVLFESPTVEKLAQRVDGENIEESSRLVPLRAGGSKNPVYCWPGLGGYTMNLRPLAGKMNLDRPFYGVQAHGINKGETAYPTIREMAAEDVAMIRRHQPSGPYTLWGYSFGARVAFETAYQLEQAGEEVEHLFLIAPGSPDVESDSRHANEPSYRNKAFVTILFSVFAGSITGPMLHECLKVARDDDSFAVFISSRFEHLDTDLVKRLVDVVRRTYEFRYNFRELAERRIGAPITIFKAQGDDYSFIENSSGYSAQAPTVVTLDADHYSMLREPDVGELANMIRHRLRATTKEVIVPHVNIKHFPASLSEEKQSELLAAVTKAVKSAFSCDEGVISIALEPVEQDVWNDRVYLPEIVNGGELLHKRPNY